MLSSPINWYTWESPPIHQSFHSDGSLPRSSRHAFVKEIGAHKDSGHTQKVKSLLPSHSGTGTPHSMLPDKRNGTKVLPVRQLILRSARAALALSRSSKEANTKVTDGFFSSAMISCAGNAAVNSARPASYAASNASLSGAPSPV